MKKLLLLAMLAVTTVLSYAQNDVTKFLGIPVDGFKKEMRQKLIAKGFLAVSGEDYLEGEFNGADVNVYIATNNNKVYRIMLADKNSKDEAQIKIRYNKLIAQFTNNQKYVVMPDQTIPDDEDISYEMTVNNKSYQAAFFQKNETNLVADPHRLVWISINRVFGEFFISMFYDNLYNQANGEDL